MTHPKSPEAKLQPENPFLGLIIKDNSFLNTLENRYACEQCCKSRKYFCYSCFIAHPELQGVIPHVKLPIKIDIIKHRREIDGKSTAAHAAILAPDDVKIHTYPDIPDYTDERVVLIFPSHTALEIPQLFDATQNYNEMKSDFDVEYPKGYNRGTLMKSIPAVVGKSPVKRDNSILPITRAVFIDSTWNQSRGIYKDERIKRLPCVVLQNRVSQFWRHQKGSPRWYLATIEAIHQFVLEVHINMWGVGVEYGGLKCCFTDESLARYQKFVSDDCNAYKGQYDDLLYFFEHMYKLIHTYYDHDNLYAYKRRMM